MPLGNRIASMSMDEEDLPMEQEIIEEDSTQDSSEESY